MSLDLHPQTPIANLTSAIERLAAKARKSVDTTPPDESAWARVLDAAPPLSTAYTLDQLDAAHQKQPVTWFQSGAMISVTLEAPLSAISVDQSSVSSAVLRGAWWGPVASVDATAVGDFTQLVLVVESQWPYLVRGGDPDALSCYFLALVALDLKALPLAEAWLRQSALLGSDVGLRAYAIHLFETVDSVPQAIYFLCQAVLKFRDDHAGFLLAKVLLENAWSADPVLAENLLCRLCSNGFPDALTLLGRLYLTGARGVAPSPAKSQMLLQIAVIQTEDEEAARLLQTADFTEKAAPPAPAPGAASALDWAVACAIAAGGAALAYYGVRLLRRWVH
jgi:TPR repeat protein